MDELREQREKIRLLMEYAVPDERLREARDLLDEYRDDRIALDLLHEFYSYLPEARDDWARDIRLVGRSRGVFLLALVTGHSGYLYLVSSEGIEFHGRLADGFVDRKLLEFFSLPGPEDFKRTCAKPGSFPRYEPLGMDRDVCPACHAVTGEVHEFGCPVEVCPWCGGQLIHCNCRFDRLEIDELVSEEDLDRFLKLVEEKGRIPYAPEQRPFFADEGPGVVIE